MRVAQRAPENVKERTVSGSLFLAISAEAAAGLKAKMMSSSPSASNCCMAG